MTNIIVELSKYLIILLMACYTFSCFSIFTKEYVEDEKHVLIMQNIVMFLMHFLAYMVMYLKMNEPKLMFFYAAQVVYFLAVILLYSLIYPTVSKLIVNNMCMLISIGLIMITRLNYGSAVKQFIFAVLGSVFGLVVPVIIRKMKSLIDWTYIYAGVGLGALTLVAVFAATSGGAKLGFEIAGIGIQPSEFVKILFVFFVASSLKKSTEFKNVVVTTALAAAHVLILVLSTDLGAALIMFVVYLVMLYVATQQPLYAVAGVGAGSFAAVIGYKLFAHIKVRVAAWKDPFATYSDGGYQVAQSLFAIGTGSWFGMGLCQGSPDLIPVAETDFIFSAIAEELGVIFALCLILVCVSCYVMFLNIAMEIRNRFYKLIALGLGTCYIFQVFLTIGGVTRFIPSTGVTLPLVSYGGSSMLSTMIMFGIIQGLYIIREDEEEEIIEKKRERANRNEPRRTAKKKPTQSKPKQQRPSGTEPERPKQKRKKPAFEEVPKQRVR
ncbi:FtsW/RodA/SpoVE family cell cycle protein [Mediterraneibacter glycyrrhizinilyticus]|uniref:FtsW/RodA/SpoVE family cell cycle protein n=1 Tax=Mediterraneibacter glycyrrhizinilyticus TaxID=342942 RepID=UPI0006D27FD0